MNANGLHIWSLMLCNKHLISNKFILFSLFFFSCSISASRWNHGTDDYLTVHKMALDPTHLACWTSLVYVLQLPLVSGFCFLPLLVIRRRL